MTKRQEEWCTHPSWQEYGFEQNGRTDRWGPCMALSRNFIRYLRHSDDDNTPAERRRRSNRHNQGDKSLKESAGKGWYLLDDVLQELYKESKRGQTPYLTAFSLAYVLLANEKGRLQYAFVFPPDMKHITTEDYVVTECDVGTDDERFLDRDGCVCPHPHLARTHPSSASNRDRASHVYRDLPR